MTQSNVGNLSTRAMLVDLTIKMWTARKTDKRVSDEVSATHGSDREMGRYWKNLLSPERMEPLRKLATRAQADHRDRTLPWLDSGARILLGAGYAGYSQAMRTYGDDYRALVMTFLGEYDQARAEAQRRLNGLFDPNDYPPAGVVQAKFAFAVDPLPFPNAADFRTDIGDEAAEAIRRTIRANERAVVERAMSEAWGRVHDVVAKMVDRLGAYQIEPDGKASGVFRDSLVENVRDLTALLPTLNLTDDPTFDQVTDRMRAELCKFDAQTLRESPQAREDTRDAADEILAVVNQFMM